MPAPRGREQYPLPLRGLEWKTVTKRIEAIYEQGVLRPVEPLVLEEKQRVTVLISDFTRCEPPRLDVEYIQRAKEEVARMVRIPRLEEVQERLSKIPGALTEDFIAKREDG